MALKFPNQSHRVGTIKDSVYSISSIAEYIKDSGKATVQSFGPSSDGKSKENLRASCSDLKRRLGLERFGYRKL